MNVRSSESGSALVFSILTLLVLSTLGMSLMASSRVDTAIAGNSLRYVQALDHAETGVAEALARMRNMNGANYVGEPRNVVTPGWGVYLVNGQGQSAADPQRVEQATDGLDNDRDGTIDEPGEHYPEVVSKLDQGQRQPWMRVEYRYDAAGNVLRFGDHDDDPSTRDQINMANGAPIIDITSEGRRGTATRQVAVSAVKPDIKFAKTSMYSESDDFKFNGNSWKVSGEDHDPATGKPVGGSSPMPGIATTGNPGSILGALRPNQEDQVQGLGSGASVLSAAANYDLDTYFRILSQQATIVLPEGTYSGQNWGDYDDYQIVLVDGDLHTSGDMEGGGVLLVNGDYSCTGQFTWHGVVIVMGDAKFSGGGKGVHVWGGIMIQGDGGEQIVSGQADLYYSSEAIDRIKDITSYQIAAWNEL